MNIFNETDNCPTEEYLLPGAKTSAQIQLALSGAIGVICFTIFCIIRPRWKSLYAARRRGLGPSAGLPLVPDSYLGWIPVIWRVTDDQVLQSAGLDAFVFLKFFKVSIRLFSVMLFFAAVILLPINNRFWGDYQKSIDNPHSTSFAADLFISPQVILDSVASSRGNGKLKGLDTKFLWSYLVFTWFFTALTIYYFNSETFRVNKVRQEYMGAQKTVTDRTFRVTGIPPELRSEAELKKLVEKLEIGSVENVLVCRDWSKLDALMNTRTRILQKLERTWAEYLNQKPVASRQSRVQSSSSRPNPEEDANNGQATPDIENGEADRLLAPENGANFMNRPRPQKRIRYGFLYLRTRKVDAIDYWEEKLRQLDIKIVNARKKSYAAADLAFVTMDSTAASQMAIQALIGPVPGQLLTKAAPSPSDVVWKNTYKSRTVRRLRSWSITLLVTFLSLIWLIPVAAVAWLVSLCAIKKLFPTFGSQLEQHEITKSLVQTNIPTLVVTLLNISVPFLYEYLSYRQGLISIGDVELSIVSKNFFFTFFNIFLVFAVSGTATGFWAELSASLKDTTHILPILAKKIIGLNNFYLNFIMLQGIGLFPVKLLDLGSVFDIAWKRMRAKTPRDFHAIAHPRPVFSYGFFLPIALLVFLLCIVYSVLPLGYLILSLGLVYFILGYFTYKYQLLFAMEQPQHATGGAWRIICYRVILSLVIFQFTMAGILALNESYEKAILVGPLTALTIWYSVYWKRRFEPLTRFIALKSVRYTDGVVLEDDMVDDVPEPRVLFRRNSTIDENRDKGTRFINPNLISPLEAPWITKDPPPAIPAEHDNASEVDGAVEYRVLSNDVNSEASSSFSLGDTHIWRRVDSEN